MILGLLKPDAGASHVNGERIVTSGYDGTARVFRTGGGPAVTVLRPHADTVWSATFSSDGKRIVTAQGDGTARVFPAGGGKALVVLRGHTDVVTRAAYSPDGSRHVVRGQDCPHLGRGERQGDRSCAAMTESSSPSPSAPTGPLIFGAGCVPHERRLLEKLIDEPFPAAARLMVNW